MESDLMRLEISGLNPNSKVSSWVSLESHFVLSFSYYRGMSSFIRTNLGVGMILLSLGHTKDILFIIEQCM